MPIRWPQLTSPKPLRDTVGWVFASKRHQRKARMISLLLRLHENEAKHQQETVGRWEPTSFTLQHTKSSYEDCKEFLKSLYDNIDGSAIEIDLVNFSGPDFEDVDNRLMSLQL